MTSFPINFNEFITGGINPSGIYAVDSNVNIGSKTSPFIPVKADVTYTFTFRYDWNKLMGISTTWSWGRVYTYDSDFQPIAQIGGYNEAVSWKIHEIVVKIPIGVRYIRFSASHITNEAITITLDSDEIADEFEDGKIILKLHANGNFETKGTPLIQDSELYSFTEDVIKVPSIIKLPSYKNYFIEKTSVSGYLRERDGLIELGVEYDRSSDFIPVVPSEQVAICVRYKNIQNARPWFVCCYYNANKAHVSTQFNGYILPAGTVTGEYATTFTIPNGVAYLRVCTNLFSHPTTDVKLSIEKAPVATVVYQPAYEDLIFPDWVKDTGQPISIFSQGIVIKGDLIQTDPKPQ